jgi:hypothetical protein
MTSESTSAMPAMFFLVSMVSSYLGGFGSCG